MLMGLAEFNLTYEKFCREEGMDDKTADELKKEITWSVAEAMSNETDSVVKNLFKRHPDLMKSIGLNG